MKSALADLIDRQVVSAEELLLVDNLDERLAMIAELNSKIDEFLEHATDEDFERMFEGCRSLNG